MDRRRRERCIPDASSIPIIRRSSSRDRRPVEMATKAWIPWEAEAATTTLWWCSNPMAIAKGTAPFAVVGGSAAVSAAVAAAGSCRRWARRGDVIWKHDGWGCWRVMGEKGWCRWTRSKSCFSSSRTSSSHSYLVLPTQTRGHPQWQQVLLIRATAIEKSQAMIFRFLFCEAEQQQVVCVLKMRNEGRRELSRAGWKRLDARRHWHWLVLQHPQGWGARDAWSAPYPSAANTCTRNEVTHFEIHVLFPIIFMYPSNISRITPCLFVEWWCTATGMISG